ncbi:class I SAM-dependent methyltransferase [Nocardia terpenica]|uniref:class I SAM-dependent methyltransferase n=1 Tax=Nocardia terpenica TaxID=455432 RepID=UPI001892F90A|nr:class I SAM-dependent methyltransferase [Nocardia terpenica]MBF6063297.1 class I SAM-dependent methyltransferase [Nocardia terpenica]MBF6105853.1 class I SAM-dependent methyltransferase [Nocardia terpenica]MBF6113563.1 class I SAM-dependent methyltransferase [Nocardia terpenica]MBF6119594.1 class I SAM-dependent methyltransferase [Nocardia terpenica]MBF6152005.1 class I SAM-dependent methyltransferase [Nocardia terpenica]
MANSVRVPLTTNHCRICGGRLAEFLDLGRQPLSDAFVTQQEVAREFFYRLTVGLCPDCGMAQLIDEVPRDRMFHHDYPYYSSGSSTMRSHFEQTAQYFLDEELTGHDPFAVEIGCNDGVMLKTIGQAGVRHLGFEPSGRVADVARSHGIDVRTEFFEESTAKEVRGQYGPASVIFAANTICHIPYLDSVFRGVDALLSDTGVFVFEDPYLGDIVEKTSFDQIYDEHFYFFTAGSVRAAARQFGFELVDVQRLTVHGGEVRYTIARAGARQPKPSVEALIDYERERRLADLETLESFANNVVTIRNDLVELLRSLRADNRRVVGYGATAKSATVTNFCGIDTDLVSYVCDTTPAKQGLLTPGQHIPVKASEVFSDPYPDYAVLFAWNHAEEIMAKEKGFRESGGRWILYVPTVRIV